MACRRTDGIGKPIKHIRRNIRPHPPTRQTDRLRTDPPVQSTDLTLTPPRQPARKLQCHRLRQSRSGCMPVDFQHPNARAKRLRHYRVNSFQRNPLTRITHITIAIRACLPASEFPFKLLDKLLISDAVSAAFQHLHEFLVILQQEPIQDDIVLHQAPTQLVQETKPVIIREEDLTAPIPAAGHMVQRARKLFPRWSWHAPTKDKTHKACQPYTCYLQSDPDATCYLQPDPDAT